METIGEKIDKVVYLAVETIQKSFESTEINLISDVYVTNSFDNNIGVKILILDIEVFLPIGVAKNIDTPYGKFVAEEFVYEAVKGNLKNFNSEFKKKMKPIEKKIKKRKNILK